MRLVTLAEYLDVSVEQARKIANSGAIPAVQYTPRGDRYYLREDADAYLSSIRNKPVLSVKEGGA